MLEPSVKQKSLILSLVSKMNEKEPLVQELGKRFPMGLRVLVVDDDPLCLMILERMLLLCNYKGFRYFPSICGLYIVMLLAFSGQ